MRFSRLRLNGFKSFVDPVDLLITDGLTGVVGPNGCGKSNLLEALRWVMGENRPKSMRGSGMEDVIFAGAATRPARNFAEVSIHIDNSKKEAPSAFNNQDSLEIIRRITRDAGSAYKSNGKDIRARDIQMLFADASTGSHSPALVRQGQIAELINAKPKSRRRILEEAAGISGLYQRRHEAELKLNASETNLSRVEDVLEQLNNQLTALARQAKQAIRYREINEQLRKFEGILLYGLWKEAEEALKTILAWMGEDPNREGLLETPKRVIKAFREYFGGYTQDAEQILDKTFGDVEGYDDMVVEKNISVTSHCEHHMAPIVGTAHVAYIPNKRVVGLSKLARVVEVFSKRLQTQERLTMQVAKALMNSLDAKGVAVTIDASHQCMTMRGIKKENATTVTNYFLGQFKEDLSVQNRYLRFISK